MEPTTLKLLCPICGREIHRLTDLDTLRATHPKRKLTCLNGKYAHYKIKGGGHYLARYKSQLNFIYNTYLSVN